MASKKQSRILIHIPKKLRLRPRMLMTAISKLQEMLEKGELPEDGMVEFPVEGDPDETVAHVRAEIVRGDLVRK